MFDRKHLIDLFNSLDAGQLRRRLDELDDERTAVISLLRAARARERTQRRAAASHQTGEENRRE